MTDSKIDKKIKNARLAVERATAPQQKARAERQLASALADKKRMKVTRR